MDPKRSGAGVVGGGSGVKVLSILDRPIAKRTGTSEVRRCLWVVVGSTEGGGAHTLRLMNGRVGRSSQDA
jgi:hypothetical protein